jgi:hypothetical protein
MPDGMSTFSAIFLIGEDLGSKPTLRSKMFVFVHNIGDE